MKLERTNKQGQDHEEGNHVANGGVRPWKTHIVFIKHMQHVSTWDGYTKLSSCPHQSMWTSFWSRGSPSQYMSGSPAENVDISKVCFQKIWNREASVEENDDVPHAPLPLLDQHWEGVCHVFQRHHTSFAGILGLRSLPLRLLEEEEDKAESNCKEGSTSAKTSIVAEPVFF